MDGIADGSMKKKDFSKAEQHCDSEAQRVHFIVKNIRPIADWKEKWNYIKKIRTLHSISLLSKSSTFHLVSFFIWLSTE